MKHPIRGQCTRFSPRTSATSPDAAFGYDAAGDVLHDDTGRSFTYDALSMTTGATAPLSIGGTRNFAYIYTADDERIALVEKLAPGGTTTNWTLRGLDNHLLRTWTNSSTSGWSWREDDIWRGAALLAYESPTGVRHYGLDHLGSPALLTDATAHPVGTITFDAFGNGGATGAGMLQYTGHERDSANVGTSSGTVVLPDYLHARYYDSTRGRFLSIDPTIGNSTKPQSWNRYTYALANPLNLTDPTGRCGESIGFIGPRQPCSALQQISGFLATAFVNSVRTSWFGNQWLGAETGDVDRMREGSAQAVHMGLTLGLLPIPQTPETEALPARSNFVINLGGEGEVAGVNVVNVQAGTIGGNSASAVNRAVDIARTTGQGQPMVVANGNALPFQSGSVNTVVTNNVPINLGMTYYGPSFQSLEIIRILSEIGQWIGSSAP